eukprot:TRINITY_DN12387_c0_g1_i1.p1 TRINITY_DN12387_c0_g1~~TRINITY_DN12387_c0_g1_i1.p1  ORF type:complete len:566 (+),score=70.71 TRINITY_DN12387_c0_g1_i1:107-1804(+)
MTRDPLNLAVKCWRPFWRQDIFRNAVLVSVPNGCLTYLFLTCTPPAIVEHMTIHSTFFSAMSLLISVFVAFRASQAYARFWEGATAIFRIRGHFFDVASTLVAFTRCSKAANVEIYRFHHTIVRIFSILETLLLAELAGQGHFTGSEAAFDYNLIDPNYFHADTIAAIKESCFPIELIVQWIQSLIVEAIEAKVVAVPAPICTRAFQELQRGIAWFHTGMRITEVPIPFPYVAATRFVLMMHWFIMPAASIGWSNSALTCAVLATIQVSALFVLDGVAGEMENPFGTDANDLKVEEGHIDFNNKLRLLLLPSVQMVPKQAESDMVSQQMPTSRLALNTCSLRDLFGTDTIRRMTHSRMSRLLFDVCPVKPPADSPPLLEVSTEKQSPSSEINLSGVKYSANAPLAQTAMVLDSADFREISENIQPPLPMPEPKSRKSRMSLSSTVATIEATSRGISSEQDLEVGGGNGGHGTLGANDLIKVGKTSLHGQAGLAVHVTEADHQESLDPLQCAGRMHNIAPETVSALSRLSVASSIEVLVPLTADKVSIRSSDGSPTSKPRRHGKKR